MRRIEKEEERLSFSDPSKQCYHLCIVNLGMYLHYVFTIHSVYNCTIYNIVEKK